MKRMTDEEALKFQEECCVFKDYKSIDEYIEDIVTCLVYSSWHYSEERARQQVEERMAFVKNGYENKMPVDDCYVDVGYNCG